MTTYIYLIINALISIAIENCSEISFTVVSYRLVSVQSGFPEIFPISSYFKNCVVVKLFYFCQPVSINSILGPLPYLTGVCSEGLLPFFQRYPFISINIELQQEFLTTVIFMDSEKPYYFSEMNELLYVYVFSKLANFIQAKLFFSNVGQVTLRKSIQKILKQNAMINIVSKRSRYLSPPHFLMFVSFPKIGSNLYGFFSLILIYRKR